jgi:uncharacterized protein
MLYHAMGDKMSNVYLSDDMEKLISNIDFSRLKGKVGIKVHFGEKGCTTYMSPKIVKMVYDKVTSLGVKAKLIETNVLYRGSRVNSTLHKKTAIEHGFDFADIDILDGEKGEDRIKVNLDSSVMNPVLLGAGIKRFDSLIIISHFKGHILAGYGGVFKNLGMGFASRQGKLKMHADISPSINTEKCTACGACKKVCNYDAITLNPKAKINDKKCVGCAMCIEVCRFYAVNIPFGNSSGEYFHQKIVEYARGVFEVIPIDNCIFLNLATNITKDCDCMGYSQTPSMKDIGYLYSTDPVALDKACLDLGGEKFQKINSLDKTSMLDYAEKKGLGKKEYKLVRV